MKDPIPRVGGAEEKGREELRGGEERGEKEKWRGEEGRRREGREGREETVPEESHPRVYSVFYIHVFTCLPAYTWTHMHTKNTCILK